MTDQPLTHILRTPLPWRESGKTICGKPVGQYADGLVVNLPDAQATVRRLGKQRFALLFCMTCASNADRWSSWEDNPRGRLARELGYEGLTKTDPIIDHELRAIVRLIEVHRGEFDELVESYASGGIVTMASLRESRSRREAAT